MKADQRKKQILDAALKAFAEHGYERTSIEIICQKASIARPTLYQYFKNKRALFRELMESYLLGIHKKIHARQEAKDNSKALSQRETMQSLHRELSEEFSNNRDFLKVFFKEAKAKALSQREIMQSLHRELLEEFSNNRDFFKIFFKEAKARNAETEDIVKGLMQGLMKEFVSEMRQYPNSEAMSEKDMEFTVMYMIGGMMQIVEYYLFDNKHALSLQELAEKITSIEAKIKGV